MSALFSTMTTLFSTITNTIPHLIAILTICINVYMSVFGATVSEVDEISVRLAK